MQSYQNKNVLIFGLGLNQGGVGSARFFAAHGAQVKATDLKDVQFLKPSLDQLKDFSDITYTLGEHKYEDIDWADLIIKNPAVKPGNPFMEYALKKGKQVEMDMGIFLQFVKPSQIIGVTGTKGKSTIASLIYEILQNFTHGYTKKSAGVNLFHPKGGSSGNNERKVILAGNIGKSVLDTVKLVGKETLVILEISSFQLEAFAAHKTSPHWAVITNITPDHLNYYPSMDEYLADKKIIGKYQTKDDFLFIRKDDPVTDQSNFLKGFKAKIIHFSKDNLLKDFKPKLLGEHNLENMAAAYSVGKTFNINSDLLLKTLTSFKGIPFRMELVKVWHGVKIYNDTTATSPEAGIQAIKTASHISSGNVVLICGGMNKGMDYKEFAKIVSKNCKKVFFLEGDVTDLIRSYKPGLHVQTFGPYNNFDQLLKVVKSEVKPDDIILFSPAATSFNLFQNEFDRGRKFNQAVKKVFKG